MEIENSSDPNLHLRLKHKFKAFSQELDSFSKTVDQKFDEFKQLNMAQYRQSVNKENEMEVESTGVSLTPKESVRKFKMETDANYLSEEDRIYDGEQKTFKPIFTTEQYEFLMKSLFRNGDDKTLTALQTNAIRAIKGANLGKPDRAKSRQYFKKRFKFDLTSDRNDQITQFQNVIITEKDLERLSPRVFLNDTLINFYIKLLQNYILDTEKKNDFHFFNTYFFTRLKSSIEGEKYKGGATIKLSPSNERETLQGKVNTIHKKLRKWHKKIKLLDKKHVFIPVNKRGEHWSLIVICNLNHLKSIITKEKNEHTVEKKPMILYFDSLVQAEDENCEILRMYLESEVKHCFKETYTDEDGNYMINKTTLPYYQILVPRQKNMTDCGIFILEYMERFCEDPEFILDGIPDTIDKLNWFPSTLINKRRDLMAEFLININTKSSRVPPNSEKIRGETKSLLGKRKDIYEKFKNIEEEYDEFDYDKWKDKVKVEFGDRDMSLDDSRKTQLDQFFSELPPEIEQQFNEIQNRADV